MFKFFIKSYGCQANIADSAAIANFLELLNGREVRKEFEADLIIVNTCAIRDKAERKFFSYLGLLRKIKNQNSSKIIVIGCIASYRKEEILKDYPFVDYVLGAREDLDKLKTILLNLISQQSVLGGLYKNDDNGGSFLQKSSNLYLKFGGFKAPPKEFKRSLVNIMTGCNNYCTYCIVPFVKGREISYPASLILKKIREDIAKGTKEVTLLGQNVNSYRDPESGFGFETLLSKIVQLKGEFWVRFLSPHPKDMSRDLLKVIAEHRDKLCAFLHHPLQSGSNKILKLMNRTYTKEQFLEQIGWMKELLPGVTISTDIIVGFPGEERSDFEETMNVVEEVRFNNIFSFIYSPRKYTRAASFEDNCSREEKVERINKLQQRQKEISSEENFLLHNKKVRVLVEKRLANGKLLGRTEGNVITQFDGSEALINKFVEVKIIDSNASVLKGALEEKTTQQTIKKLENISRL